MDVQHLVLAQREGLAVDQILDRVDQVHRREVLLVFQEPLVDRLAVGSKQSLGQLVMPPLLQLEVHDAAEDFEQVLDDVL